MPKINGWSQAMRHCENKNCGLNKDNCCPAEWAAQQGVSACDGSKGSCYFYDYSELGHEFTVSVNCEDGTYKMTDIYERESGKGKIVDYLEDTSDDLSDHWKAIR